MPLIGAAGTNLYYERSGSGPPLLAIMGMAGSHLTWGEPFLNDLRQDFEVIVYNHRGVGDSSRVEQDFTIMDLAVDAVALMDALELEGTHVLGISMGGMVAQELTLSHPDRVESLVLGCTYCGGAGSSVASSSVFERLGAAMRSGDRERAIRTSWEVNVSPAFASHTDAYDAFREGALRLPVAVPVIMAQMQAIARYDTSARLPGLRVPPLVLHGTEDQMLGVENGRQIASLVPGARLELFEGVGHLFFWEQPQRAAQLVRGHVGAGALREPR